MISVLSEEEECVGHLPIISALYCNNLKNRTSSAKNVQKQISMQHSVLDMAFVVVRFLVGKGVECFYNRCFLSVVIYDLLTWSGWGLTLF